MKTKVSADFQICTSVPLDIGHNNKTFNKGISKALFVKQYYASLNVQDTTLSRWSFLTDFHCVFTAEL